MKNIIEIITGIFKKSDSDRVSQRLEQVAKTSQPNREDQNRLAYLQEKQRSVQQGRKGWNVRGVTGGDPESAEITARQQEIDELQSRITQRPTDRPPLETLNPADMGRVQPELKPVQPSMTSPNQKVEQAKPSPTSTPEKGT